MYEVAFSHKYHYDDAVPGVTVSAKCDLCKQDNFMDNPNAIILTCSNLDLNNTFCIVVCCSDLFARVGPGLLRRMPGGHSKFTTIPSSTRPSKLFPPKVNFRVV